jgi:hypothetical protein
MSTIHPTLDRFIRIVAPRLNSKAQTAKGILRALKSCHPDYQVGVLAHLRLKPSRLSASVWKAEEAERKSYPEAKRAKADKNFRKNFLARLRRQEKRLLTIPHTIEGVDYALANRTETNKALQEILHQRILMGLDADKQPSIHDMIDKFSSIISIPYGRENLARQHGAKLDMRGKSACVIMSYENKLYYEEPETKWKNGRPVKYTRATRDNYVRSFAIIRDDKTLDFAFVNKTHTIILPEGYKWDTDHNGIRAVEVGHPGNDHHPTANDLLGFDVADYIINIIETNKRLRAEEQARKQVERAELDGVFVCLADSLRAGNCLAGTLSFGERHGLDQHQHYSAQQLLDIANGDTYRVRLALSAARRRHTEEMQRGYANLADHYVPQ